MCILLLQVDQILFDLANIVKQNSDVDALSIIVNFLVCEIVLSSTFSSSCINSSVMSCLLLRLRAASISCENDSIDARACMINMTLEEVSSRSKYYPRCRCQLDVLGLLHPPHHPPSN